MSTPPLEMYLGSREKIRFLHNLCGSEIEISPDNLFRGKTCRICSYKKRAEQKTLSNNEWVEIVNSIAGDEYIFLEDYAGSKTKILVRHTVCGHEYRVSPEKFGDNRRCPKCKSSNGEKHIVTWLEANGYGFEREVTFPGCRDIGILRFDFKIFRSDGSWFLLEYDGNQHFNDGRFGGLLKDTLRRDKIKNDFCLMNKYELHRIPYTLYDRPGASNGRIDSKLKEICDNSDQGSTTMEHAA